VIGEFSYLFRVSKITKKIKQISHPRCVAPPTLALTDPTCNSPGLSPNLSLTPTTFLRLSIASKTTTLTEVEIARLSTTRISRHLEPEINCLCDAAITELFNAIFLQQFLPFSKKLTNVSHSHPLFLSSSILC